MPVIMKSDVTFPGGTEGPAGASQQSSLEGCFSSQVDCGQPAPKALSSDGEEADRGQNGIRRGELKDQTDAKWKMYLGTQS